MRATPPLFGAMCIARMASALVYVCYREEERLYMLPRGGTVRRASLSATSRTRAGREHACRASWRQLPLTLISNTAAARNETPLRANIENTKCRRSPRSKHLRRGVPGSSRGRFGFGGSGSRSGSASHLCSARHRRSIRGTQENERSDSPAHRIPRAVRTSLRSSSESRNRSSQMRHRHRAWGWKVHPRPFFANGVSRKS